MVLVFCLVILNTGLGIALEEKIDQPSQEKPAAAAIDVGNKICPVSGDKIGDMGEPVKYEYKGKVYNLCCKMCLVDFKKDPQKFSQIAEEEVKSQAAPEKSEAGHHHVDGHDHHH